jgi:MoxR-like ATPase
MTIADSLGNPLPADLVNAQEHGSDRDRLAQMAVDASQDHRRVQPHSHAHTVGPADVDGGQLRGALDQIYECPEAAWYLTANDDAGGGTYQVIEALRDRIDMVVKALHFNTRFLRRLAGPHRRRHSPGRDRARQIIFTEEEIEPMHQRSARCAFPPPIRGGFEFFASQFEFFDTARRAA